MTYILAASKPWFKDRVKSAAYQALDMIELSRPEELDPAMLVRLQPRYIFFTHWNWKVPDDIVERFECVCFHTAPLPFGRGGSPIQNLILRGLTRAPVNALRMTDKLDAGPVYQSIDVSLEGDIQQIFDGIADVIETMILSIIAKEPIPVAQQGEATWFDRLTSEQSALPDDVSLEALYDRIRMVDGLDYPRAFLDFGRYRLEFTDAELDDDALHARVTIRRHAC